ncbi:LamG-like jellyroll fold domain-containing protein [Sphingobacterium spiritivorum]|uniref:DUF4983 domain-containing protein n=2 Tax=Sphingobacterium spiritivorum TaxID=258 RepID=D7VHZ9_SPHSI|nr:LamG-like jellyroll fold domain-containing protein [Sphingobacterium spiritivorum]EEI91403.1 hypothetical protein HMPREF0765_3123 [Sphingobacterium spiritivorum ATCC 33300]EFK59701.1 hypothetical protein HMPREF0766_10618 [Sphingobacterium spiritivorum ATCC 33861]QQS97498.1 DUF4983 domain-containing protein [Sphingobacterium spiritivorum]QQT37650.1 DUF4983 domain-containing protein [Sphingobacterium spiritivorum]WQD34450.1 DUF4983 domain-containing protein [Sphingobacterium spiritivorum]
MMKSNMFAIYAKRVCRIGSVIVASVIVMSCNKDFPNLLNEQPVNQNTEVGKPKVLYIIVDGLRGNAVLSSNVKNLTLMQKNALYTFNGLTDYKTNPMTNEIGWASMLTGVYQDKHKVTSSDLSTVDLKDYPTVFTRLKSIDKDATSSVFASSDPLVTYLGGAATAKKGFAGNDEEMSKAGLEELKSGKSDLIVMQFHGVDDAGQKSSYESTDAQYISAINKVDQKIGEAVEIIRNRPSYSSENWLIIVSSSKGGKVLDPTNDQTVFGDAVRNTFTMFYSPKFRRKLIAKLNTTDMPFVGNAVGLTYGEGTSTLATLENASQYNFANNKNFTVVFFFKYNEANAVWNYPVFFSKREEGFGGAGWNFFGESGKWGFNSSIGGQVFGPVVNDGNWHAVTVVVNRTTGSIKAYTDGVFNSTATTNGNNLDNTAPLRIGKIPGSSNNSARFTLSNLQIYNVAFTDEQVKNLSGITQVDPTHDQYANLIGYWPGYSDVGTARLKEKSGKGADFVLTGRYDWLNFSDKVDYFRSPLGGDFYHMVPNSVDVPFMIYQWFGTSDIYQWSLDGKGWTPNYILVRD